MKLQKIQILKNFITMMCYSLVLLESNREHQIQSKSMEYVRIIIQKISLKISGKTEYIYRPYHTYYMTYIIWSQLYGSYHMHRKLRSLTAGPYHNNCQCLFKDQWYLNIVTNIIFPRIRAYFEEVF